MERSTGRAPTSASSPFEAMERELALDAEQTARLRTIAAVHDEELTRIGRTAQASVRDILHAIEEQLRPRLRPDKVENSRAGARDGRQ